MYIINTTVNNKLIFLKSSPSNQILIHSTNIIYINQVLIKTIVIGTII